MPRRKDLKKILVIGAGPIVIGQACEFDYSGAQACKSLKEEGYEIIEMLQFKPGSNYTIFKKPGKQNPAVYKIDEISID